MYVANKLKCVFFIVLSSLVLFSCSPQAKETDASFELGKDYEIVRDEPSKEPKLVEHFSLYCGHCFSSEPLFKQLKASLDKSVPFERSHVLYFPKNNKEYARNMTFAFAAAGELGIEDEFVAKVFDFHFKQNTMLGELNDLKNIFVVLGQTSKVFQDTMNSEKTFNRYKAMAAKVASDNVRFTPDLIVNDKYRVKLGALASQGNRNERLAELVNYLLTNP